MGKRKQELPRRLPSKSESEEPLPGGQAESIMEEDCEPDISKLENVVKKLKTSHLAAPLIRPPLSTSGSRKPETSWLSADNDFLQNIRQLEPQKTHSVDAFHDQKEPLDLRVQSPIQASSPQKSHANTLHRASVIVTSSRSEPFGVDCVDPVKPEASSKLSYSILPSTSGSPLKELSEKLEGFFSNGIAAARLPRKMVRGQDIWMQDIEQKRAILRCLKCSASFNSLAELAKHLRKSGHGDDMNPFNRRETEFLEPQSGFAREKPRRKEAIEVDTSLPATERKTREPSAFRPVKGAVILNRPWESRAQETLEDVGCSNGALWAGSQSSRMKPPLSASTESFQSVRRARAEKDSRPDRTHIPSLNVSSPLFALEKLAHASLLLRKKVPGTTAV